jgi:hypothetical protein
MQAQRLILETNQYGKFIHPPQLPANTKWEAIFLHLEKTPTKTQRKPSLKLRQALLNSQYNPFEPIFTEAEIDAFMNRTAEQIAGIEEAFK